jgi:beta-galactosidase GanA
MMQTSPTTPPNLSAGPPKVTLFAQGQDRVTPVTPCHLAVWLATAILALLAFATPLRAQDIPRLERRGNATQLMVDGQPFLILGGELGNSSASSRDYMRTHWPKLRAMNLNTVLAPVYWEVIEPDEGRFDFSSVDGLLEDARAHDLRLVLLWFGTWKNSTSSYAPAWVKRDTVRFARTRGEDGRPQEIISAFSEEARDADARAFAALMRHLKVVDGDRHTVLMIQVENEVGFLPFATEGGNSTDLATDERARATAYARYIEAVAAAGKREYPLPMYVNGAQGRPGVAPGDYPSGGPLAHLAGEWRRGAPSIDFIAPDVYFPNFAGIADRYVDSGNPLFVPEANRPSDERIAANALHSIGHRDAIGFSPFAIEGASEAEAARIAGLYEMLESIAPLLLSAQAEGRIAGFANSVSFEETVDEAPLVEMLGSARFTVTTIDPWTDRTKQDPSTHGALLIWLGGEDYLLAGQGVTLTVEPAEGRGRLGFDWVEEGRYEGGRWIAGRRLNGDQTHQGRHVRLPPGEFGIQRFRVYRY